MPNSSEGKALELWSMFSHRLVLMLKKQIDVSVRNERACLHFVLRASHDWLTMLSLWLSTSKVKSQKNEETQKRGKIRQAGKFSFLESELHAQSRGPKT